MEIISGKSSASLPIAIFDSGIGGLSVLHEALKILPRGTFKLPEEEIMTERSTSMDFETGLPPECPEPVS